MKIKVSIVIISYNQGRFIEETIKSVLNQSYENVELLLIDGGSTDETMDVVEPYRSLFSVVIHEKDKGQTDAINKGFKLATGDLVGWINSDDILYPECVGEVVSCYENNPQGSVFYSETINIINIENHKIGELILKIPTRNFLLKKDYDVNQPGSFYLLTAVQKANYLNEELCYCMDLDLWLTLLNYGTIHGIGGKPLAAIRVGDYTKTSNGGVSFLREIRSTLLKHGASIIDPSMLHTYWDEFKCYVKRAINYKK